MTVLSVSLWATMPLEGTRARWHLLYSETGLRLPSGQRSSKSVDLVPCAHVPPFPKRKEGKQFYLSCCSVFLCAMCLTHPHGRDNKMSTLHQMNLPSMFSSTVVCLTKATSPAFSTRHLEKPRNPIRKKYLFSLYLFFYPTAC